MCRLSGEMSSVSCRYSARAGLEISGKPAAIGGLANDIRQVANGEAQLIRVRTTPAVPGPYDSDVSFIEIARNEGPLRISQVDGGCHVVGGREQLELLADNVEWLLQSEGGGAHLHLEYFPGHAYIDASAEPLVVQVADETSR
jgi:hypothetical protein